jgi:Chaperone of endosialidase
VAVGQGALRNNTGDGNAAVGYKALFANTSGSQNVAVGQAALRSNIMGTGNTAVGFQAATLTGGSINATASGVTAFGYQALRNNNMDDSTAIGYRALLNNLNGTRNTVAGNFVLQNNTTGNDKTTLGNATGRHLTTGDNNIDIRSTVVGVPGEINTIQIGFNNTAAYIAGISGEQALGGDAVFVTSAGKLGTVTALSSVRFEDDIKPMGKTSEAILTLKPVSFRYKKELDPRDTPQFGLVAEEVAKVNPDLVKRDRDRKLQTVRYEAVNAMLLNEFLKKHRKVEGLEAAGITEQKEIAQLRQQLKAQAAVLQKAPRV